MLDFMKKFLVHLEQMEIEFDTSVQSTFKLNQFLFLYEQTLHKNYTDPSVQQCLQKVYETPVVDAVTDFPNNMQNPFKVILRFIKFEILDIEAILEAIEKKNTMQI